MSVEAGQEAAETLLTGGFGKAGMVVFGFTVDASKVARRSIKIADTVGDYSRLPRRFLPDIKVSNRSYKIKADTSKFEEGALQHIFDGSAKGSKSGKVSLQGFHHEGENIYAKVTKVLKTDKATGVYEPEVEIFGYKKDSHPKAK
ncbi:MAG: hypothetical protein N2691_00775 [Patescibacteria group bacterium]|nr:hypothetical protein [Patescibacteria group bacterium]